MLMLYLSYFQKHILKASLSPIIKRIRRPLPSKAITGFIQNFTAFYIGCLAPVLLIDAKAYV